MALVSLSSLCQGTVKIKFLNSANGRIIIGPDSIYRNFLNEPYSISKLKYYISNVSFGKKTKNVFLIDAYAQDSLILDVPVGRYNSFSFLMGVDSIANCSGAQDGALDPLNDMFWAWNSGYVMFKLEGNSDSSKADLKRIEHHIGGYRGKYKTMREVDLVFEQPLIIENREEHSIRIEMNLDNYWRSMHNISIYKTPVIVTAGPAAMLSADNFPFLFKIISIE